MLQLQRVERFHRLLFSPPVAHFTPAPVAPFVAEAINGS